jgi:hypothetical protein
LNHGGTRSEFPPERHWSCVLQLRRASHHQRAAGIERLAGEGLAQGRHRVEQLPGFEPGRQSPGCRIDIIRTLRCVDVNAGMNGVVVSSYAPKKFERAIGDHFVGIHVRRCLRSTLNDVNDELVMQVACGDLVACPANGFGNAAVDDTKLGVGMRRRLFDPRERPNQLGYCAETLTKYGKVLGRSTGMNSPIRMHRNSSFPEKVFFGSKLESGMCHGGRSLLTPSVPSNAAFDGRHASCA